MRKFKQFLGQVVLGGPRLAARLKVKGQSRRPVSKLRILGGERFLVDFGLQSQIQQAILLLPQRRKLAIDLGDLGLVVALLVLGANAEHPAEPVADLVVLNANSVEQLQHLKLQVGFADSHARVSGCVVAGAPIVDVGFLPFFRLLELLLAGDRMVAERTSDQAARVY